MGKKSSTTPTSVWQSSTNNGENNEQNMLTAAPSELGHLRIPNYDNLKYVHAGFAFYYECTILDGDN
jgi:hypothetical protein